MRLAVQGSERVIYTLSVLRPQYKPIDRKKRQGQTVEDKKGTSSLGQ